MSVNPNDYFKGEKFTKHFLNERLGRLQFIADHDGTLGNTIKEFVVDKGHENGKEIHTITDTGLIIIRNAETKKIVTLFYAKRGAIVRHYLENGLTVDDIPKELLRRVRLNQIRNWVHLDGDGNLFRE